MPSWYNWINERPKQLFIHVPWHSRNVAAQSSDSLSSVAFVKSSWKANQSLMRERFVVIDISAGLIFYALDCIPKQRAARKGWNWLEPVAWWHLCFTIRLAVYFLIDKDVWEKNVVPWKVIEILVKGKGKKRQIRHTYKIHLLKHTFMY